MQQMWQREQTRAACPGRFRMSYQSKRQAGIAQVSETPLCSQIVPLKKTRVMGCIIITCLLVTEGSNLSIYKPVSPRLERELLRAGNASHLSPQGPEQHMTPSRYLID